MSIIRTRWAAVGAAVAVTLGAGGVSLTQAAIGTGDKPVYVALDAPCRVIDTRLASPIGAGETSTLTVQITGPNGDCTGSLAVPAAAVAVATNVTAIRPSGAASGRSFFTVYPADAALPITSNLNFVNGQPPTPNKVDVGLSSDGKIKIYNNEGTAHAAVDIFGYYIGHHHDDRYYTESESDARFLAASQDSHAAFDATSGEQALTATDTVFASVTVDTPTSGYVILNTGGYVLASGGVVLARCSITTGTEIDFDFSINVDVPAGGRAGIGTTRTFVIDKAILPGSPTATYNFVCDAVFNSVQLHDVQLNATFIPDPTAFESS